MTDEIPCAAADCFNAATHEVVPRGRWRNLPIVKACRGCSKKLVANYRSVTGEERGWADIIPMIAPVGSVSGPKKSRRRRK